MKKERGFTLVELLVVMAMISALVALLLPSVGKAMDRARDAQCSSRIRQSGIALLSMIFENGNTLVTHAWQSNQVGVWAEQIENGGYLSNRDAYYCPIMTPGWPRNHIHWATGVGYGLNMFDLSIGEEVLREEGPERKEWVADYNQVQYPSDYLLLADSLLQLTGATRFKLAGYAPWPSPHLRHAQDTAANVFFFDGHIAAWGSGELLRLNGLRAVYTRDGKTLQH
jgi:prepilin-type N-terminal cleavage/methylation domain-containing protein/prepilin-type processing-associated H-X9-DG protein